MNVHKLIHNKNVSLSLTGDIMAGNRGHLSLLMTLLLPATLTCISSGRWMDGICINTGTIIDTLLRSHFGHFVTSFALKTSSQNFINDFYCLVPGLAAKIESDS